MDLTTLLILGVLGGAAWLYFGGGAAPATPSPLLSSTPVAGSSPTPTLATGPISSTGSTIAAGGSPASTGSTMSSTPVASSEIPPDSYFIQQAQAAYQQGTGLQPTNKYFVDFTNMLKAAVASLSLAATGDNCSGYSTTNVSFAQAAQLAGTAAGSGFGIAASIGGPASTAAGVASVALPIIGIGVAIATIVGTIFAHHAAKVKEQAQLDCAMVAACNNAWNEMRSAIAAGQLTAAQALQGFESVYSQAAALVAPMSNGPKPGDCNNPCNLTLICRAVTNKLEAMYGLAGG